MTPTRSAWKSGSPRCRKQIVTVACHGLQVITQRKPTDTLDQAFGTWMPLGLGVGSFLLNSVNKQTSSDITEYRNDHRTRGPLCSLYNFPLKAIYNYLYIKSNKHTLYVYGSYPSIKPHGKFKPMTNRVAFHAEYPVGLELLLGYYLLLCPFPF